MDEIKIPKAVKGKFCGPKEHSFKYLGGDCVCMKCGYFVTPNGKLYRRADKGDEGYVQNINESATDDELMMEGCHIYPDNVTHGLKLLKTLGNVIISNRSVSEDILTSMANIINQSGMIGSMTKSFTAINILATSKKEHFDLMIMLDSSAQSPADFVQRFVDGKETLMDRLAMNPILTIKINPDCFTKMKDGMQLPRFFKALFKYCNHGMDIYSDIMFAELLQSGYVFKELVKTTELMGLVTLPLSAILVFDEVDINSERPICCCIDDEGYGDTINAVRYLVNQARILLDKPTSTPDQYLINLKDSLEDSINIKTTTGIPNESKERVSEILSDLKRVVKHANAQLFSEHTKANDALVNGLVTFVEGGYNELIADIADKVVCENVAETIFTEGSKGKGKVRVKKLKKIPADIIPYILIEAEAIRDANDKMMIASYAYAKMELIDFYLEVLETGSKRYIVPHNKPYLENLKRQLQAAIKKIMDTPVPTINSPIVKIEYPNGYEG